MNDFDSMMQAGMPEPVSSVEPTSKGGFLANPKARIAVIAGAAVALLAIVGVVVALVLQNFATDTAQQVAAKVVTTQMPVAATAATTGTATAVAGNKQPTAVTDADAFIARDPFEPVLHQLPPVKIATPTVPVTTSSGTPTVTITNPATPPAAPVRDHTLILENIFTDNGKYKALLSWNGDKYEVGEGEQLGKTPWKVLSLTRSTATMQYGDIQVTLSIGEGVQQ